MLELKEIYKTFNPGTINEKRALNGVSLTLADGDFVTVIGGNGAGKSTLLNAVAGVWPVDSGTIAIDGIDVTRLPEHKRAQYIGRVFQDPMMGTAATMQIEENLALAARRGKPRGLKTGITAKEREEYRELLKILDLGLEERETGRGLPQRRVVGSVPQWLYWLGPGLPAEVGSPASWTKVTFRPPGGLLPPCGEEDASMNDSVLMKKLRSQDRARMGIQHT